MDALTGPNGPIAGLMAVPDAGNLGPLVDGLVSNSGFIRGDVAPPLNDTLSGLLVNQDPDQFATGLQTTVEVTVAALMRGLGGGAVASSGAGGGGAPGLPGLDALPASPGL